MDDSSAAGQEGNKEANWHPADVLAASRSEVCHAPFSRRAARGGRRSDPLNLGEPSYMPANHFSFQNCADQESLKWRAIFRRR
jgi:hypothetical protein